MSSAWGGRSMVDRFAPYGVADLNLSYIAVVSVEPRSYCPLAAFRPACRPSRSASW
jgi:hypothetical protein